MEWTYGERQLAHIAVVGAYRCRVWYERGSIWSAIVIHQAMVVEQESFSTLEAAKAWCEDYVRQASP